jgi:pyruvate dehydrogenase E2 component (dihydrolipoamide acetyltransferase)
VPIEVVMPKLGLTMASGTIARWIKQPGETVREGEPLLEVATDKINYEVAAPASGTVVRALGRDGEEFPCGSVIGLIALAGESDAPAIARAVVEAPREPYAANGSATAAPAPSGARIVASPAARRLARERDVPLATLRGTGPRGRITLADIPAAPSGRIGASVPSGTLPAFLPAERRAIFRKMTEVGALALAQVETVAQVDAVRALIERRRDFRWTAYAVFAVARLLRDHPAIRTDATTGAPFDRIEIGIAADTPQGLIVPVVRSAEVAPLAAIEAEIVRLAVRARAGTLSPGDVGGACFSISNVGPQGIERVAPLPDPPQTAILGIGAVTQRPAVVCGALVPAWMMTCVLSFDHRFIDGAPAARFLADLARAFADPGVLL